MFIKPAPGEIKRSEVNWTLKKKLDASAGPGEIKGREVVLDHQVSPEEIMSREVVLDHQVSPEEIMSREAELGCESWIFFLLLFASSCYSTAVQRILSS